MRTLIKSIFGSKLYGTEIPSSDTDYKFLFLPEAKDLVLQKAPKHIQQNTKVSDTERNGAEDVDCEGFSLQQWFHMLTQGQTLAVEMLFLPKSALVGDTDPLWDMIQENKDKLVSKKISPFVGYCRAQSSKYSCKAERVIAAQNIVEFLKPFTQGKQIHAPLYEIQSQLMKKASIPYIEMKTDAEHHKDNWLKVCGREIPLTATIFRAYQMYEAVYADYGKRAKIAASENGIDWKSLYHALRIAHEANELLRDGYITLPRPEASLLKLVRTGAFTYQKVSDMIQDQVDLLEQNLLTTTLQEEPDHTWIDSVVYYAHLHEIRKVVW